MQVFFKQNEEKTNQIDTSRNSFFEARTNPIETQRNSKTRFSRSGQRRLRTEVRLFAAQVTADDGREWVDVVRRYRTLWNAIHYDDARAVELFLRYRSDPNEIHAKKINGVILMSITPLSSAICRPNPHSEEIVALLLKYGADPNLTVRFYGASEEETPIHVALRGKHYGILEAFVRANTDLNKIRYEGRSLLEEAIQMNDQRAIEILLGGGAER